MNKTEYRRRTQRGNWQHPVDSPLFYWYTIRRLFCTMALSQQTLDHLLEAESHLRAAVRSAATNEKPLVITQISQLLMDVEHVKTFEKLQDIVDSEMKKRDS